MSTHFVGFCDFCREARSFTSAEARDYWETHHEEHGDEDE